jgi:hypothetical protein
MRFPFAAPSPAAPIGDLGRAALVVFLSYPPGMARRGRRADRIPRAWTERRHSNMFSFAFARADVIFHASVSSPV